jgi:hypothetical protein
MALTKRRRGKGGTLTLEQFADLLDGMPAEIEAAVLRGLRSAARRGQGFVVEEIDHAKPWPAVNTGELRASVKVADRPRGSTIYVDSPHFGVVEFGSRPHMPPVAPLVTWAARKFGVDGDEAEAIAWAVALKIAKQGTEPRAVFQKAMVRTQAIVTEEIEAELALL